jgi:predicted nucleic acid-binding protein
VSALVDTSVWIEHFRNTVPELTELLDSESVLTHSSVIGEIALGSIRNRREILESLHDLPGALEASPEEVMRLVEEHRLFGRGLSLIGAQVLASALLSDVAILTRDQALQAAMKTLGVRTR